MKVELSLARERLYKLTERRAQLAFSRAGCVARYFRIGGHIFCVKVAGTRLAQFLTRALAHLETEAISAPELTINCWDSAAMEENIPAQPEWPSHLFSSRGDVRGLDAAGLRVAYFAWLKLLNIYSRSTSQAFYYLENSDPFPLQQFGSPALTIFSWWFDVLGWQFTHAAAVACEKGNAVLIAGPGGAGKSTLAFSALGTSLRYVSDDYCVLVPGAPPQVLALYNSGKLNEGSLTLLPHLRKRAANLEDAHREKSLFFLHEQFGGEQVMRASLRAILSSELHPHETSMSAASSRQILGALGESTLRQLAGSSQRDLMRLMRIIQSLPAFRLRHGADPSATADLISNLCAS